METSKQCFHCKIVAPASAFYREPKKRNPFKLTARCKMCIKEGRDKYYKQNKNKICEQKKHYYKKHLERISAYRESYYYSIRGHSLNLWNAMNQRVKNKKSYQSRKILFSKKAFLNWLRNNEEYQRAHILWGAAYYDTKFSPTIDRIDNKADYSFDNLQILRQQDNSRKAHLDRKMT